MLCNLSIHASLIIPNLLSTGNTDAECEADSDMEPDSDSDMAVLPGESEADSDPDIPVSSTASSGFPPNLPVLTPTQGASSSSMDLGMHFSSDEEDADETLVQGDAANWQLRYGN
jgi:hypothetical protein